MLSGARKVLIKGIWSQYEAAKTGGGQLSEMITLRLWAPGQEEVFFKVKQTTEVRKVFQAYASRNGYNLN